MYARRRPKLLRAADLAERTGLTVRYFQKLAKGGTIDWATQPGGPRSVILFEEDGFLRWLDEGRAHNRTKFVRSATSSRHGKTAWKQETSLQELIRSKLAELKLQMKQQSR